MKVVLVDDEPQSHKALTRLLSRDYPQLEIIASAYNVKDGVKLITYHQPDLVFLDVELTDGLGFDVLKQLEPLSFQVIFITAFDHYARTAIRFGAIDYLLKPVSRSELAIALSRVFKQHEAKISSDQLAILWDAFNKAQTKQLPSRIAISTAEGILYKPVQNIVRLEASQNYTRFLISQDQRSILASHNIGEYAEQFEPYLEFMRVHRSHVINLSYVDRYVRADGGYLVLQDGYKVSVSKGYKEELLGRMGML